MKNKIARISIVMLIILVLAIIHAKLNYVWIFSDIEVEADVAIGIIDGRSSGTYIDIIYNKEVYANTENSHGDAMIQFVKEICPNAKIFYYDASDENGKIKEQNIIDGIQWMIDNHVRYVNISLSSKKYSEPLNEIIQLNKGDVNMYSSYNNLVNSFDYPSMYEDVIASGAKNKDVTYKSNDMTYPSNKVIVFPYDYNMKYTGNSYLSLLTMLREIKSEVINEGN